MKCRFCKPDWLKMFINGNVCSKCQCLIFSRYRHDFVECECGNIFVDGGQRDYKRMGCIDLNIAYYNIRYYIANNFKGNRIKDWKLNFFEFYKLNVKICNKIYDYYRNKKEWPDYFPLKHLVFDKNWESNLTNLISQQEKEDDVVCIKIILPFKIQRKIENKAIEEKKSFDNLIEEAIIKYLNPLSNKLEIAEAKDLLKEANERISCAVKYLE